jgi:integrase
VQTVQTFLNRQRAEGHSINKLHKLREVLGSALGQAMHEELVSRNVAWRVKLPSEQRDKIHPWTFEEVISFLEAAKTHQWHAAFTLIAFYGLRRGEVLGLRWGDVKFATNELHIRQQVFRAGGRLQQGPVKTAAGQRELPLRAFVRDPLVAHQAHQAAARAKAEATWRGSKGPEELVFTTPDGGMVEPQNFSRSFQRLCVSHGLRRIKLHHVRHTTNTLLKMLGAQPRDRQLILGHSNVQTTQQLYEHDTMQWRNESLGRLERALSSDQNDGHQDEEPGDPVVAETTFSRQASSRCRQISRQELAISSLRAQINSEHAAENKLATGVPVASWVDNFYGDLTGNRTRIARMRSQTIQPSDEVQDRLTTVSSTMQEWGRQWKLGIVAVNLAVKSDRHWRTRQ